QAVAAYSELESQLKVRRAKVDDAEGELAKLESDVQALVEQKRELRPDNDLIAWKRAFKEWPIINGFNPHLKIQYDWPADLEQTLGMTTVSRVDRCRSCHVNIDSFGAGNVGNYPQDEYELPFCTHPNGDVYLTATSPHPVNKFGCTICHEGDGSGTSFQSAEHTPPNPAVGDEWHEEFGWHSNHFWEYPMHPKQFIESSCLKCHHDVIELGVNEKFGATAPKVYEGYSVIRDYGCFGCHEINGYDGTTPIGPDMRLEPQTEEEARKIAADPNSIAGKMRKVGPSLRHIDNKTTPEFVAYWTADPQRFRPDTRMPKFFDLTNQHDALAGVMQPIELAAIARYLQTKSQDLDILTPSEGYEANAERGKDLFKKRGCLACHARSGEEFAGINADFGPDLSRIHEKVKPGAEGFNWLYTWIKEPTRYHTRTRMPDLYLNPYQEGDQTIDPAADIAAFLLQGEPTEFPALATPQASVGVRLDDNFTEEEARQIGLSDGQFGGVRVLTVLGTGPASRAEVKSGEFWVASPMEADDVITRLNGQAVTSPERFEEIVSAGKSGEVVEMTILRGGREFLRRVTLSTPLEDLTRLFLSKSLSAARVQKVFDDRHYPVNADMYEPGTNVADFVKGDEIELVPTSPDEKVSEEEWQRRMMVYVGRRTISRYGCYGCHDIPEFETARPIGTALQDWGRKDTSKLAYEHIHEFLHHHGDPDGSSTAERLERAVELAEAGVEVDEAQLTEAYFYKSVISHGRAGFLWQKLRQPRSYDYKKTETKGWDERLRMPKFPFDEQQIEAVATFVLGLVAEPPAPEYIYNPEGSQRDIIEGERLLAKYNCAGCHLLEFPKITFAASRDDLPSFQIPDRDRAAWERLLTLKPIQFADTGRTNDEDETLFEIMAYQTGEVDEDDPEYHEKFFTLWNPHNFGGEEGEDDVILPPSQPIGTLASKIESEEPARGGDLALWLAPRLINNERGVTNVNEAWQASPPPLYREGTKVQTPWLYEFLKNPEQLRYTTVMRMPKFNMDDEEALSLANYFAAKDREPYPYQSIPQRQRPYQIAKSSDYQENYPMADQDYLTASWHVLNRKDLCNKCHSVGGVEITETDPTKVKRGPNLSRVEKRLRPDYTDVWVYNPAWILPYTSMPVNFPSDKESVATELFGGSNPRQAEATIDALFNYTQLLEAHGQTVYTGPGDQTAPETPAEEEAPATTATSANDSVTNDRVSGGAEE
ncbi:MAG: c-type cytochrome, partial [Planctomycetaceae bacterium]|nr:c-type cytochrome [Planctomycetaceae bacterium]